MAFRRVTNTPDWDAIMGKRVRLYRNLQTLWITVQVYFPGLGWRVQGSTQSCLIQSVHLEVNYPKYRWVIANNRRTVCAWAEGVLVAAAPQDIALTPVPLGYNPFKRAEFYDKRTDRLTKTEFELLAVVDNEVFVSSDAVGILEPYEIQPVESIFRHPFQFAFT